jgi:hypothetical protein
MWTRRKIVLFGHVLVVASVFHSSLKSALCSRSPPLHCRCYRLLVMCCLVRIVRLASCCASPVALYLYLQSSCA